MRPVLDPAGLDEAIRRSASEAEAAFGDPAVYVEELLARARHIEVQVIGDGTAVAVLGDRDCSLQRRRQKLIEIAPAPLPDDLRARLHEAARTLIASTACTGLATVEFLVTGRRFVFLEVQSADPGRAHRDRGGHRPRPGRAHAAHHGWRDPGRPGAWPGPRLGPADPSPGRPGPGGPPETRRGAIQARVNIETCRRRDPSTGQRDADGVLAPGGPGIRVDTYGTGARSSAPGTTRCWPR